MEIPMVDMMVALWVDKKDMKRVVERVDYSEVQKVLSSEQLMVVNSDFSMEDMKVGY